MVKVEVISDGEGLFADLFSAFPSSAKVTAADAVGQRFIVEYEDEAKNPDVYT